METNVMIKIHFNGTRNRRYRDVIDLIIEKVDRFPYVDGLSKIAIDKSVRV